MPHLISNLYEKKYTPFTAKLAPKNLWSYPKMGRKPQKITRIGADPNVKAFWRFIRNWVTHNHKFYYTYVTLTAATIFTVWHNLLIGYYRRNNYERSLPFAKKAELEWEINKPPEDDDDDEEDEEDE